MTTTTIFSTISYNQNADGPVVPANTNANAGAPISRAVYTLTVTPSTAFANVSLSGGPDGVNWPWQSAMRVEPNSGGTISQPTDLLPEGTQYLGGQLQGIAPGATATLTVTY